MAEKLCPLLREACVEHRCAWYTQVLGEHPQGKRIAEWGCAVAWLPVLQIECAKETRQAAAAVESARNEARRDAAGMAASVVQLAETFAEARPAPVLEVREPKPLLKRLFWRS